MKAVLAGLGAFVLPVVALISCAAIGGGAFAIVNTASTLNAAKGAIGATRAPSELATVDIPDGLIEIYARAATDCDGLAWQVIAAVSKTESDHGRFGGAVLADDATASPPIIGVALDGTNGNARIDDTDNGILDGDEVFDRAVGPFQFIPTSWAIFGTDANDDGRADPQNMVDAAAAAVEHLCPTGTLGDLDAALFGYNASLAYVDAVLEVAGDYSGELVGPAPAVNNYALPMAITEIQAIRGHHTYAAADYGFPVGSPVFAVTSGVIEVALGNLGRFPEESPSRCGNQIRLRGDDQVAYTYCHLSRVDVAVGVRVAAGDLVGLSGGEPGVPGAGNTTSPHLHFAMRTRLGAACPQPVVLGILVGEPIDPHAAPLAGCINGSPQTNWRSWFRST